MQDLKYEGSVAHYQVGGGTSGEEGVNETRFSPCTEW